MLENAQVTISIIKEHVAHELSLSHPSIGRFIHQLRGMSYLLLNSEHNDAYELIMDYLQELQELDESLQVK